MHFGDSCPIRRSRVAIVFGILLMATLPAAASVTVFGPQTFAISQGAPQTGTAQVPLHGRCDLGANAVYTMVIANRGVSSASVTVNGQEVAGESDFNQGAATIERRVILGASNTLSATIKGGKSDATLAISIVRHIDVTEAVFGEKRYTSAASSNTFRDAFAVAGTGGRFSIVVANGTPAVKSGSVRLNGVEVVSEQELAAASVVAKSVTVAASNELVVDTKSGGTGSSITVAVLRHVVDVTGPQIALSGLTNDQVIADTPVTIAGTVTDASGIAALTINGAPVPVAANGAFSTSVPLMEGANTVAIDATDCEGNITHRDLRLILELAPKLTVLSPENNSATNLFTVNVTGTASASHGIASITANGVPMTVNGAAWSGTLTFGSGDGPRQITVVATDTTGRSTTVTVNFIIDTVAPTIRPILEPAASAAGSVRTSVVVRFDCDGTGSAIIECGDRRQFDEGGTQTVTGTARDLAGNTASATATVKIDVGMPDLTIDPIVSDTRVPTVANAALTVAGSVTDDFSGIDRIVCGATPAVIAGSRFTCAVALQPGPNQVTVHVFDVAGNERSRVLAVTLDATPPSLFLENASETESIVETAAIDLIGYTDDESEVASVRVNDTPAVLTKGKFVHHVELAEGANQIRVVVSDRVGNTRTMTARLRRVTPVRIDITSPRDLSTVNTSSVEVRGNVTPSNASVVVNGIPAVVTGGMYIAGNVPLAQGRTVITALATSPGGVMASANLNIYRDSIPPRVVIYAPAAGAVLRQSPINVTGMVDDIVIGTINGEQLSVTVNGIAAEVRNRAFLAKNVPLTAGTNTLTVVGTDQGGNPVTVTRTVTLDATGARLTIVSGNGQEAAIGATLANPLVVRAVDAAGNPVPNKPVTFAIAQNNGVLTAGTASDRTLVVNTDATGQASVRWKLGTRAGAGNNRLTASAAGSGSVGFEAVARTGVPSGIVVDLGSSQFGVVGQRVQRPMIAVVIDSGSNRLANVPVTFTVISGGGNIDGRSSLTINTDSDGRAWITPALGPAAGFDNNVIEASVSGVPGRARFVASGRIAGDPAQTKISGVVIDNSNLPVPGVTLRIDETSISTQTNTQGQFTITGAPVGYVKLIVDGSTAQRNGTWPMLEFVMYTLPGDNNTLGMPIYLLPIDVQRGIQVDETRGGTLTFPEMPGFSLTVAPGSALFPSGSRAGTVSATLVHPDKMPMPPSFGQQPKFLVTIQPPGVHFDPPAKMTLPNLDGLTPGEVTELFSFDHDLGQFVSIGTGSVSEDGSTIVSDPGVGIIKGGWHSGGNPNPTGNTSAVNVQLNAPSSGKVDAIIDVTASGTPATGGTYFNWQVIDDPADPNDSPSAATFVNQPACPGMGTCTAQLKALSGGTVTIQVSYTSSAVSSTARLDRITTMAGPATVTSQKKKIKLAALEIDSLLFQMSHQVWADHSGYVAPLPAVQWVRPTTSSGSLVQDPVVYTRSTPAAGGAPATPRKIQVQAKLHIRGTPLAAPLAGVTVYGSGGGFTFKKENVVIPAGVETSDVIDLESNEALPETTKLYSPLLIDWSYTMPGDSQMIPAGKTGNPLHVVLGNPLNKIYRTSLKLAESDGQSTQGNVLSTVWSRFAGPADVRTWENRELYYYREGVNTFSCATTSVYDLLTSGTGCGQCTGFARLLQNVLGVHGIDSSIIRVQPVSPTDNFLVNNWDFTPNTPKFDSDPDGYRYRLLFPPGGEDTPPVNVWSDDVVSLKGKQGQNTETPFDKTFNSHYFLLVSLDGAPVSPYLDPSYGVTYTGIENFQETAVAGFARTAGLNTVSGTTWIAWKVKKKTSVLEMQLGLSTLTNND